MNALQSILPVENPLNNLVELLEAQNLDKKDMIMQGATLTYSGGKIWVNDGKQFGSIGYTPSELCHVQIAEKLKIPKAYYDRMLTSYPELLEYNINLWLRKDEKIKYMLRCFGNNGEGIARAMLSDRFLRLDNYDVLFTALEAIKSMNVNVKILRAEVTEKRMYLAVVCPDIELEAENFLRGYLKNNDAAGNGILSGLIITNSEVGLGSFEIRPRAIIVKCNNGLIMKDDNYKRVHLGSKLDDGTIQWSEKTKDKNTQLVMSQVCDAVSTFLSPEYLGKMVERIAEANNIQLEHSIDAIQHVCKELSIGEEHKRKILKYFIEDGDTKASGIFQAITREAQNMGPDVQFEVESGAFSLLPNIKKYDKPFSNN